MAVRAEAELELGEIKVSTTRAVSFEVDEEHLLSDELASKASPSSDEILDSDSSLIDIRANTYGTSEKEKNKTTTYELHSHGVARELPGHVVQAIKDGKGVSKWLSSRARRQHVDDYRCRIDISSSESVGGVTALHLACFHNNFISLTPLLEAGADLSAMDEWGRNALHFLCSSKSTEGEAALLALKTIINSIRKSAFWSYDVVNSPDQKYGRTPLLEACVANKRRAVLALFKSGLVRDLTSLKDFEGMTPLHCVCMSESKEVIPLLKFVLDNFEVDVNAQDMQGRTPFLLACELNRSLVVRQLMEAGADIYMQDFSGRTALHFLSASGSENIEELLKAITRRDEYLRLTSIECDGENSQDTMPPKFINRTDNTGLSPFKMSLQHQSTKKSLLLIANGADINIKLENGRTPLQHACEKKKIALAISLVNHGADIDILVSTRSGDSPLLHFACKGNYVELVDCLLKHGADVMEKNAINKSPFYYTQSYEVHCLLIGAGGFDSGERSDDLIWKNCYKGFTDKFVYLINHVEGHCVKGRYLVAALRYNHKDIAMALVKHRHWYRLLRKTYEGQNNILTTPFREMIRKMPDVAEVVLDNCIRSDSKSVDPGDYSSNVIMNFEFLDDFQIATKAQRRNLPWRYKRDFESHDCSYESLEAIPPKGFSTEWGPSGFTTLNHPLTIMAEYGRNKLLSHPVTSTLFLHKWELFGMAYYINIALFILFLIILNLCTFLLDSPISDRCMAIHANNNTNTSIQCDTIGPKQIFLYIAAALILATALIRLTFNVITLFRIRDVAILKHGVRLCLYFTSILFALIFHAECQCIAPWQWQCGVAAVFLCWINMVVYLSKFPYIGIYVIMLIRVFYTFLKVLFLSLFLVVTFGLAFFMAFHEPSILRSPFSTPARTLLKMVTMTTGEFEFDEIFRQAPNGDSDEESEIPFEAISYILWIIFIVVMPVLLTNMLVGLAVGDIGNIQHSASVERRKLQMNQIIAVEESLRLWPFRKIFTIAWKKIYPSSPFPDMPVFQLWKLSKLKQWWLKYRRRTLVGIIWCEEEQDSVLKSITNILSRCEEQPDKYSLETSELQKSKQKLQQKQQQGLQEAKDTTKIQAEDVVLGLKEEIAHQRELIVEMKAVIDLLAQNAGKTASSPENSALQSPA